MNDGNKEKGPTLGTSGTTLFVPKLGTSGTTLFVPKIQCESVMLFFLFFLHVMLRVPVE